LLISFHYEFPMEFGCLGIAIDTKRRELLPAVSFECERELLSNAGAVSLTLTASLLPTLFLAPALFATTLLATTLWATTLWAPTLWAAGAWAFVARLPWRISILFSFHVFLSVL
jgi:hypothetical protein